MKIHHIGTSRDRREWQRTRDPLAEACHVGHDAVVLPSPQSAGPAKPSLHFIENEESLVPAAPLAQRLHIFRRSKCRAPALIGFHVCAGDIRRLHTTLAQRALEGIEADFPGAPAIGKSNLY